MSGELEPEPELEAPVLAHRLVGTKLIRYIVRTHTLRMRMPHADAMVVMTTVASSEEAVTLVRALLERRLIACGTLLPGSRSLYRWEGKVADEQEVVILLKTRSARLESLQAAFAELHPYKVPELLALPVEAGLERYLSWINTETSLGLV